MALKINSTTWNFNGLFSGDDDPRLETEKATLEEQVGLFVNKWKDRDDYLKDSLILRAALDEYEQWMRNYGTSGDSGYYLSLRQSQEQANPDVKARLNKLIESAVRLNNEIQFFELRLGKVSEKQQEVFLKSKDLQKYKHFLERLFVAAKHTLSEPEEKILNLKSQTAYANWVKMTREFLSKEEREVLLEDGTLGKKSFNDLVNLMNSNNKLVRDQAVQAFNEILKKFLEVGETEFNSILQDKKVNDELRRFSRPDTGRHLGDDIETEVVDSLIKAVANKFEVAQEYYRLKAKLFGVSHLKYHERNVPYGSVDKKYTYEQSVTLVYEVLTKLDPEFGTIFADYVQKGHLDVYPQVGKSGGAFCAHELIKHPTYILLNHGDKLNDVLTIAHEVGHGINNELVKANQHALHFGTPISTAEVASTFMEDFVLAALEKEADGELRLALMMMKLNDDVSTIFRQIAFYQFERDIHREYRERGYLTKEMIGKLFQEQMKTYMGEAVEQSAGSENWWLYVGHFRRYFYVYSYASGLLISKAMQNEVKQDPKYVNKVKEFLAAGRSDSPRSLFLKLGIDINDAKFWLQGLAEIEAMLHEAELLARSLGKI